MSCFSVACMSNVASNWSYNWSLAPCCFFCFTTNLLLPQRLADLSRLPQLGVLVPVPVANSYKVFFLFFFSLLPCLTVPIWISRYECPIWNPTIPNGFHLIWFHLPFLTFVDIKNEPACCHLFTISSFPCILLLGQLESIEGHRAPLCVLCLALSTTLLQN